jgi:hypothetical protein
MDFFSILCIIFRFQVLPLPNSEFNTKLYITDVKLFTPHGERLQRIYTAFHIYNASGAER